jgi:[CysO sulfur-carrier protein]-S-L-cysteine hydrolase
MKTNERQQLTLTQKQWDQIIGDVESRKPEEACGLIAGKTGQAEEVIPITNEYHSQVRYRMVPEEQLRAFERFDQQGLDLLAIYHSHPVGPAYPSQTDIDEATYPGIIYLILFPNQNSWNCRGYLIEDGHVTEIPISIIGNNSPKRFKVNLSE